MNISGTQNSQQRLLIRLLLAGFLISFAGSMCCVMPANMTGSASMNNPQHILIVKHEFKLYLMSGSDTLAVYPIALGKIPGDKRKVGDCRTPEGEFYIDKIKDASSWQHDFKDDNRGAIPGAYGPWFLSLYTGADVTKTKKTWRGIGIHGTHDPASIGTLASEGCIRLRNADIEALKQQAFIKMAVTIKP